MNAMLWIGFDFWYLIQTSNENADALIFASQNDHVEVVKLLLANGATEHIALAHAVAKQQGHVAIVDILTPLL